MADSSVNDTFMFDALKCVWEIGKAVLAVSSPPVSAGMSITEAVVKLGSGTGKNSFSKAQSDYDSYASIFSRLMKDAFDETLKKCGLGALPQRYQNRILREVLAWDDETCIGRYRALAVSEKDGQGSKASEQLPLPDMIQLLTLNILQARSLDIRLGKLPADLDQLSREMTNTLTCMGSYAAIHITELSFRTMRLFGLKILQGSSVTAWKRSRTRPRRCWTKSMIGPLILRICWKCM